MTKPNGSASNGASSNGNTGAAKIDSKVAISPSAPERLAPLLKEIQAQSEALNNGSSEARLKLIDAAQSLVYSMETPREAILRYCWAQSTSYACVETCVNLGIFSILVENDKSKSVAELAEATGADSELLARMLKQLGATGVLVETGVDEYACNGFSKAMALSRYSDCFECITDCTVPAVYALPTWLKKNNYRSPTDGKNAPFAVGFNTDLHFFEWLHANPKNPALGHQFNNLMSAYHQGRPSWMDVGFYPVPENLIKGARNGSEDAFLVDVGGNKGHDLEEFQSKWPNYPGKLILQDQPHVLNDIESLDSSIVRMPHDFFTEQPIKGARAYFMHSILHDWNDETCQKILSQLAAAMTPGYSKLLINDNVVPATGAHWQATSLDIVMMVDFAAKERTEQQWYKLIEPVGLKIVKIWTAQASSESLIECELA